MSERKRKKKEKIKGKIINLMLKKLFRVLVKINKINVLFGESFHSGLAGGNFAF